MYSDHRGVSWLITGAKGEEEEEEEGAK